MDKQTVIAFTLIGIILIIWLYLNSPQPPQQIPSKTDSTLVAADTSKIKDSVNTKVNEQIKKTLPQTKDTSEFAPATAKENIITIETDLVKMELTSKGARIRKYYLKKYNTWYFNEFDTTDFYNRHVQLINPINGGDFNIIFVTKDGKLVNTADLNFQSDKNNYYYKIANNDSLSINFTYTSQNNRAIVKHFTFYADNYASKVDIEMKNMQDIISSFRYDVVWANGVNFTEKNSVDEATYSDASVFSGGELLTIDAKSPNEPITKDLNGKIDWVAIKSKYFAMILAPKNPSDEGGAYIEGKHLTLGEGVREQYSTSLKIPFKNTQFQKDSFLLYLGPIDYDILKSYNKNFQSIFDFGSFLGLTFLIRPISEYLFLPLFKFLHSFIPNYGLVIVIFSILIKLALHPLTRQSYKSMKKMQLLQPKIAEIKEKYKDDQQRIQKETMKLYSTYGINPMGGCLPMLLQMPILIALWSLFKVTIEIRQKPFFLWIKDLASPDVIYRMPFKIPIFGVDIISGTALLLGVTMFIQQKMSTKDPSQKALVYVMPIMFTALFMGFPSGLNIYYLMFNLLSIIQQYFINHSKKDGELVPVKDPHKKKSGFMARMMEAAEKQAQAQKKSTYRKK
ncbi:membrane protein insertase YidC [Melioribacteraceae bacterium 4301-Me]|uniref:membrane protein insertase YidC n=1 Tax=Pyranulibacter aquaticus TaxID=3163344 RepID=UPI003596B387